MLLHLVVAILQELIVPRSVVLCKSCPFPLFKAFFDLLVSILITALFLILSALSLSRLLSPVSVIACMVCIHVI